MELIIEPRATLGSHTSYLRIIVRISPDQIVAVVWIVINIIGTQSLNEIVKLFMLPADAELAAVNI